MKRPQRRRPRLRILSYLALTTFLVGCGDGAPGARSDARVTTADARAGDAAPAADLPYADAVPTTDLPIADAGPISDGAAPYDAASEADGASAGDAAVAGDATPGQDQGVLPTTFFHVRAGASGAKDGSSWIDAFGDLPAKLVRGATYYVAAGSYAARTFDDAASAALVITIKKATAAEHGSAAGWKASYGQGQAVFGPLEFKADRYLLEGQQPYGIKVKGKYKGQVLRASGDHLTLRHVELDGNFAQTGGKHTGGACNVLHIYGSNVTVDRCEIHNAADDGLVIRSGKKIKVLHSRVHALYGCGTDAPCAGECFNGHSDGFEIYDPSDLTLEGNLVYDVRRTSGLIILPTTAGIVTNLVMVNNIFYTPQTSLVVYIRLVDGAKIYNNVIWGSDHGARYGGLSIGDKTSNLDLRNNIIQTINYSHAKGTFDPAQHKIDHNLFAKVHASEYTLNAHDAVGDPLFATIPISADLADHKTSVTSADFQLKAASSAIDTGVKLPGVVDVDITGGSRPLDGDGDGSAQWDRGAVERAAP